MDVLDSSRTDPRHLTFAGTPKSFILKKAAQGWESGVLEIPTTTNQHRTFMPDSLLRVKEEKEPQIGQ